MIGNEVVECGECRLVGRGLSQEIETMNAEKDVNAVSQIL